MTPTAQAHSSAIPPARDHFRLAAWPAVRLLTQVVPLWLAWSAAVLGFQWIVTHRFQVRRPDVAVSWSARETAATSQDGKPYLLEPVLNRQVSWDSEFYLSIALAGYADPLVRAVPIAGAEQAVSLNYAFFPLYPALIRALAAPLRLLGLTPIATASLAGVLLSLLGALAGLAALHDLSHDELGGQGALRAAYYLLIFPTGFFLAMVYTEGLFVGLTFWVLALSRRGQWAWASALAALAPWVRAHGAALALPLAVAWLGAVLKSGDRSRHPGSGPAGLRPRRIAQGLLALLPLASFFFWRVGPLGQGWSYLQATYFARGLLLWGQSLYNWRALFAHAAQSGPALIYTALEVGTLAVALLASLALLRRQPALALYSLALVVLSAFSGVAQSMARYMLVVPAVYLWLAGLGRRQWFDRAWTLLSVLLLGMEAALFAFDMWVG